MIGAGLSTDQAPPVHVPFRFFFTAPFFAMAAAVLLFWRGDVIFATRWSLYAYGVTHLFTLGFLTMVMVGALFQMFPVLGGVSIKRSGSVSLVVHLALLAGTTLLVIGFVWQIPSLLLIGFWFLIPGLALFVLLFLITAFSAKIANASVQSMRHALLSLALALLAGGGLAFLHGTERVVEWHRDLTALHLSLALVGWVALLVMGVSFQVLPMFYVTPEYPPVMRKHQTRVVMALLLLWNASRTGEHWLPSLWSLTLLWEVALGALVVLYAGVTLDLIRRRVRKIYDANIWFFRIAMVSLAVSVLSYAAARLMEGSYWQEKVVLLTGVLFVLGFGVTVVNGMLYRIVPFLIWFHLNAGGYMAPNMREVLPVRFATVQLVVHLLALVATVLALFLPEIFSFLSAGLLLFSFLAFAGNLMYAINIYVSRKRKGTLDGFAL